MHAGHAVDRLYDPSDVLGAGDLTTNTHETSDGLDRHIPGLDVELLEHLMKMHFEGPVVAGMEDSGALRPSGGTFGPIGRVLLDALCDVLDLAFASGQLLTDPRSPSSASIGIEEVHAYGTGGGANEKSLHVPVPTRVGVTASSRRPLNHIRRNLPQPVGV